MPIGMRNIFVIDYGIYLVQIYREEFEDDVVVGVNSENQLECFEWSFVPELEEDLETLRRAILNGDFDDNAVSEEENSK